MVAQLHLAENALALHLLLQHLKGLVDIVVTDKDLHLAFLFDRALMGPMAKAPGPLANGYAQFGGQWRPGYQQGYEPASTSKLCLAIGGAGCHVEETKISVSRRFSGNSSNKSVPACKAKMGAPEIKNNRRHLLLCPGRHVAELVDRECVRSAGALSVDNFSSYPHIATFGSSISRVVGRDRHDD